MQRLRIRQSIIATLAIVGALIMLATTLFNLPAGVFFTGFSIVVCTLFVGGFTILID